MNTHNTEYWAGSEESLRVVVNAEAEIQALGMSSEQEPESNRLLSFYEGVATVAVHGSLTSRDSFWNQIFGITSYNEIRNAVLEALEDEDVKSIVLDMDTPGGDVKGLDALAEFLVKAGEIKPIDTFISGTAFSAGYWIASATDKIYGSKMSEAGSIGVIAMMINRHNQLKGEGVEVHIFRSAKNKALGNPYEKMTEKVKATIQDKINKAESFFLDAISEGRNIPRARVKGQLGEGKTFYAEEAITRGLIDEIISFDDLFNALAKEQDQSSAGRTILTSEETTMKKKVLTAESVAAIASGAEHVEELHEEVEASELTPEQIAAEAKEAEGEESTVGAGEEESVSAEEGEEAAPEASESAEEGEEAAPEAEESTTALVSYLKDELKATQKENMKLSSENESLKESSTLAEANETALKQIANEFISNMSIGLGMAAMNLEGMDTSAILSQYTEVKASFTSRFKVGGHATVEDGESEASSGDSLSVLEKASARTNKI